LGKHYDEINALSHGEDFQDEMSTTEVLAVTYPLRSNFSVSFDIPVDITKTEAKRLSIYLESLYFAE